MIPGYLPGPLGFLLMAVAFLLGRQGKLPVRWEHLVGAYGLLLFVAGQAMGLFWAPSERMMGEVARILYVHVPAAWLSLLVFTFAFVGALGTLFTSRRGWDAFTEATVEVGVVMTSLLLVLGSLFARPTWGVFWTWDPRLTASAVMLLTFVGVVLLRASIVDASSRALWSAAATVVAFANIPITYMSVKWWRSMHQLQSSPNTMSEDMVLVLRLNAWAFLFLCVWFIAQRWRIAMRQASAAEPAPLPERGAA